MLHVENYYKDRKLKIIAPTWNYELQFPDGSYAVSDTQDYIEYIIKKHETLTQNSSYSCLHQYN